MIATKRIKNQAGAVGQLGLWQDQRGAMLTMEIILIATVVLIGSIVGLAAVRDSVSQEFGDASAGLASIDHGYRFNEISQIDTIDNLYFDYSVSGSVYVDETNFCESNPLDPPDNPPMCMQFSTVMPSES